MGPEYDVVVIGAGVGGLACALACARRHLRVCLLEKDPTRQFRRQGFNLWLPQEVLQTLQSSCDIAAGGLDCENVCDLDLQCTMPLMMHRSHPGFPAQIKKVGAVRRGELRNKMLDAAVERGIAVRFGAEVTGVEEDQEFAHVVLKSGETLAGRVVLGSDGIHSVVRQQLLPEVSLEPCGSLCLRGAADDTGELRELAGLKPDSTEAALCWVSAPPGVGLNMTAFGGVVTWVFEFVHDTPIQLTTAQAHQVMSDTTQTWAPLLRKLLLEQTPVSSLHLEALQDLGSHDTSSRIRNSRVALLGDAAHPLVWTGGAGNAIRDAVSFADGLGDVKNNLRCLQSVSRVLKTCAESINQRVPPELALQVREQLPSCVGGGREDKHRKHEESRKFKWELQNQSNQIITSKL